MRYAAPGSMPSPALPPAPTLAAWGRLPKPGSELVSEDLARATLGANLSRGLGRSYGDSSLPAAASDRVIGTRRANRVLGFDAATGVLRAEAGLSLAEVNRLFMPRGFFTPVLACRCRAADTARSSGSAIITMPGPPPYGRSSTVR